MVDVEGVGCWMVLGVDVLPTMRPVDAACTVHEYARVVSATFGA